MKAAIAVRLRRATRNTRRKDALVHDERQRMHFRETLGLPNVLRSFNRAGCVHEDAACLEKSDRGIRDVALFAEHAVETLLRETEARFWATREHAGVRARHIENEEVGVASGFAQEGFRIERANGGMPVGQFFQARESNGIGIGRKHCCVREELRELARLRAATCAEINDDARRVL